MKTSLILSELSLIELKNEISQEVLNRVIPLIESVSKPQSQTEFLTRKEAAKLLGVSLVTIADWTKTGKIKGYRIASRIRYKRHELETAFSQITTRRQQEYK